MHYICVSLRGWVETARLQGWTKYQRSNSNDKITSEYMSTVVQVPVIVQIWAQATSTSSKIKLK